MLRSTIFLYNSQKSQRCHSQESWQWTIAKRTQNIWEANMWFGQVQKYRVGEGTKQSIDWKLDVVTGNSSATVWDQGKNNGKINRCDSESIKRRRTRKAQAISNKHEKEFQHHKWNKNKRGAAIGIKEEIGTLCPLQHCLHHSPFFTPNPIFRNSTAPCKQISWESC